MTGCACGERCGVVQAGGEHLACIPLAHDIGQVLAACDTSNDNSCGAGLVCMKDNCNDRCYRVCRTDGDCAEDHSRCSRRGPAGLMVCEVPSVSCTPTPGAAACADPTMGCYVSSNDPSVTLCDCPWDAPDGGCTDSRTCSPGALCAAPGDGGAPTCMKVCQLDAGTGCDKPYVCTKYYGLSPGSTVANPSYGYCAVQ